MFINVWRLEHLSCDKAGHGPIHNYCYDRYPRPEFGSVGRSPKSIELHEVCGVTFDQLPYWWSIDGWEIRSLRQHWAIAGWYFNVYKLWEHDTHRDNVQILFNKNKAINVTRMGWNVVPFHESIDGVYGWHEHEIEREIRENVLD